MLQMGDNIDDGPSETSSKRRLSLSIADERRSPDKKSRGEYGAVPNVMERGRLASEHRGHPSEPDPRDEQLPSTASSSRHPLPSISSTFSRSPASSEARSGSTTSSVDRSHSRHRLPSTAERASTNPSWRVAEHDHRQPSAVPSASSSRPDSRSRPQNSTASASTRLHPTPPPSFNLSSGHPLVNPPLRTQAAFVGKLYAMLEDEEIGKTDLIHWSADGTIFTCPNPTEFAK